MTTDKYFFTIQQSAPVTKLYDRQYTYYVTDTETGEKKQAVRFYEIREHEAKYDEGLCFFEDEQHDNRLDV